MSAQQSDPMGNLEKEWEMARGVLKDFDDRIDGLRKYGFTFVTALLTAQSLLVPYVAGSSTSSALPDVLKLGIVSVTLLLIFTLKLIESGYQSFQRAATSRANIIERQLNLELTENISDRYKADHVRRWFTFAYAAFILGASGIGYLSISPPYSTYLIFIAAAALVGTVALSYPGIDLNYEHGKFDWTIDKLECAKDGQVLITMTNMDTEKGIALGEGQLLWEVRPEGSTQPVHQERAHAEIVIGPNNSVTWAWKAIDELQIKVHPGIYRVYPTVWNVKYNMRTVWKYVPEHPEQAIPLRRKVTVVAKNA